MYRLAAGFVLTLLLCLPLAAQQLKIDTVHTHIEERHYEEAVRYASEFLSHRDMLVKENPDIWLCLVYGFWDKGKDAAFHCGIVTRHPEWPTIQKCAISNSKRPPEAISGCPSTTWEELGIAVEQVQTVQLVKYAETLTYYRIGDLESAAKSREVIRQLHKHDYWPFKLFIAVLDDALKISTKPLTESLSEIRQQAGNPASFDAMLSDLRYGIPTTAVSHAIKNTKVFYTEHPLGRSTPYLLAAFVLSAGLVYVARKPLWRGISRVPAGLRAHRQRRREKHLEKSNEPIPPVVPPRPVYFDWRYPNKAYKYASYFNGFFWLLIAAPLVALAAIPAWTVLMDFSPYGLKQAVVNAENFIASFPNWGRPWFALILLTLTGFIILKIYGRYSLPKNMRPKVRVFHTSVRLVLLAAFLGIVGTGLIFVSSTVSAISDHPIVKKVLSWL